MNDFAVKARKGAPKRRISGVRPAEGASDSAQTLPAFEPIERRALPFEKPFDRRRRVKLDPATVLPSLEERQAPAQAKPPEVPVVAANEARPVLAGSVVLGALLLVTALATAFAWLVWGS